MTMWFYKIPEGHMKTILLAGLLIFITACGDDVTNTNNNETTIDTFEGVSGDDSAATASAISIGDSQSRTISPLKDVDWVAVDLVVGTDYEFTANQLCPTCDSVLNLFDTDGVTELASNDDYSPRVSSNIKYTPGASGTYYLRVEPFSISTITYMLSTRVLVDGDSDGRSDFYDCNDANGAIAPWFSEIANDGIDQDCSGADLPLATAADIFEPDNDFTNAVSMQFSDVGYKEIIYQSLVFDANTRTLDQAGDIDYFKLTVPARSAVATASLYSSAYFSGLRVMSVYDSDGVSLLTELADSDLQTKIRNTSSLDRTYYLSYSAANGTDTGVYVPTAYHIGSDLDGDSHYSNDNVSDCDDTDTAIFPGATETVNDGVDSNCNGEDNT